MYMYCYYNKNENTLKIYNSSHFIITTVTSKNHLDRI